MTVVSRESFEAAAKIARESEQELTVADLAKLTEAERQERIRATPIDASTIKYQDTTKKKRRKRRGTRTLFPQFRI